LRIEHSDEESDDVPWTRDSAFADTEQVGAQLRGGIFDEIEIKALAVV